LAVLSAYRTTAKFNTAKGVPTWTQDEILRLVSELLPFKIPQTTLEAVAESVDSVSMSLSFMADYSIEDDDPSVWRDCRRKAIVEGKRPGFVHE